MFLILMMAMIVVPATDMTEILVEVLLLNV